MTNTTFADFGLTEPLAGGLARNGFTDPTPIQAQAIAPQMAGRDLLGIAQTGTGKTAAFGLPMLHELIGLQGRPAPKTARALILTPTRELAVQIRDTLVSLAHGARITTLLVLGGMSRSGQIRALTRGVDILIATPGRLTDLIDDRHVRLDETRILVLDEADRMLDMGFVKPVQRIAARLHPRRRTALFSATMPKEVEGLVAGLMNDPLRVEVTPPGQTISKIDQSVELVAMADKRDRLRDIVSGNDASRVIVFARTKHGADRVVKNLERDGIDAAAIHGNKAQNARQRALKDFSAGRVRVLVATDIAARGIDVQDISHVVQYDLPDEPEAYVHRMGRTGRNGAEGKAIAFCMPDEGNKLRAIERLTRIRLLPDDAPVSDGGPKRSRRGNPSGGKGSAKPGQARHRGAAPGPKRQQDGPPKRRRNGGNGRPRRSAA